MINCCHVTRTLKDMTMMMILEYFYIFQPFESKESCSGRVDYCFYRTSNR